MTENWCDEYGYIRENLQRIEENIQNACAAAGRQNGDLYE